MGWKVTNQSQTVARIGPGEQAVDVVRVYFETDTGYSGYVDISTAAYNASTGADQVRQMINDAVDKHDAVANLSSE